jgi:hypothetical protein
MRVLFVFWLLIIAGFVPARLWPTSVVGEAPPCNNPALMSGMPTCDNKPAWRVFVAYYSESQLLAATDSESDGETKISNGF